MVAFSRMGNGSQTQGKLNHRGWREGTDWEGPQKVHDDGWRGFLGNLRSVFESGTGIRPTAIGMKPGLDVTGKDEGPG